MSIGVEKERRRRIIGHRERLQQFRAIVQCCDQRIDCDHFFPDALREVVERNRPKSTLRERKSARDSLDAWKIDHDGVAT